MAGYFKTMAAYFKKSCNGLFWIMDKIAKKQYMKCYPKYLRWLGVKIDAKDTEGTWISPTIFLDSSHYDLIEIGKGVTISFDVSILVHDFSIVHAARLKGKEVSSIIYKNVKIGSNCFIGAKSLILPGTVIGDNCIIGGGTVVKGILEPNSIYIGNPCRKISSIEAFAEKYSNLMTSV